MYRSLATSKSHTTNIITEYVYFLSQEYLEMKDNKYK